jgi:DNA (cytosine-5)-methyltransferase 1
VNGLVLEGFAGVGGWSTALAALGHTNAVGVELDPDACATATAAGHRRVRADVARFPLGHLAGRVDGAVMSPPCQSFSRAGARLGILDQPALYDHLTRVASAGRWVGYDPSGWHDPRSPLVLQPVRWVDQLRPRWVALEQVPDVLPFWEAVARWLRGLGYSTACGLLSAERFGVPQTRLRAFLVARNDGVPARLPAATHQRYVPARRADEPADGLFDAPARERAVHPADRGLLPWASMADALGIAADRPGRTVAGHRAPRWAYGTGPASYRTGWTLRSDARTVAPVRASDEPAGTVFGSRSGNAAWVMRTNQVPGGADGYQRRPAGEPSPTVSGQGRSWAVERPATAVCGDPRLAGPGHRDREGGQRQYDEHAVRVEVWQAGVLQGFPAGYPWRGTRTAQYRQVGDAVPPPLAAAVLSGFLRAEP